MSATRLIIKPEDPTLLKNDLLAPSLILINGLKYGWSFSDNLLQQEHFTEDALIIDFFTEREYDEAGLLEVQSKIEAIVRSFSRLSNKNMELEWQKI